MSAQDKLLEKLVEKIILDSQVSQVPNEHVSANSQTSDTTDPTPGFSLSLLATNLRKLNSKARLLLHIQSKIWSSLNWSDPTATISILLIYTLFCLNPHLLAGLPALCILVFIMAPGYDSRHPLPDNMVPCRILQKHGYSFAEAQSDFYEEKEMVKQELYNVQKDERELSIKLRDFQNTLTDIVNIIETCEEFMDNIGSFAHERRATAIYILLLLVLSTTVYLASFLDMKIVILVTGWVMVLLLHPAAAKYTKKLKQLYLNLDEPIVLDIIEFIERQEVIVDNKESKYVQVFELQRRGLTSKEWIPWTFTLDVYDESSPHRKATQRPTGTRFLRDVKPPRGWKFKKGEIWKVDQNPEEWVLFHGTQHVQVAENGWVYDYYTKEEVDKRQQQKENKRKMFLDMIDGDEYSSEELEKLGDAETEMIYDGDEYFVDEQLQVGRGEWRRRRLICKCCLK